jgi:hypothetical protein
MLFNLKAVPRVDVNYDANEFFLSVSKEEMLLQHKKDYEKFYHNILCDYHAVLASWIYSHRG